jgi:hypothetical protein
LIDHLAIVDFAQRKPTPWQDAIVIRGRLHELMSWHYARAAAGVATTGAAT